MSQLNALKAAENLSDVAHLLDVKPAMLSFLLYKKPKKDLYAKFDVPKRHGGTREISSPEGSLKLIQRRLADLLQNCVAEIELKHERVALGVAHGFRRDRTIMTNARQHRARRYVFNIDLHDFFGSINFGRVRGLFLKDKNFLLRPEVATVIAQIVCNENKLPQGSPCSPVVSNLIGHVLDMHLVKLAKSTGCTYTRYADDLSFSTNKHPFPSQVAKLHEGAKHEWVLGRPLERLISKSGFAINCKKTRMQYSDSRQEVTGLVVNRKVNVPVTYRHTVRAMAESLFRTGIFQFYRKSFDKSGSLVGSVVAGRNAQLLGMFSYIDHVDLFNQKLRIENNAEPEDLNGRTRLFRRALYFDSFYAPTMPLIVCEGKTDNTYLKHAMKSLAASYPALAMPGSPPKLSVKLFKYAGQRKSEITEITGGVGGLCKLIKNYHSDVITKFKAPLPAHPVIILIDNDSGANSVFGAIAGITKKIKPTGTESFIHVTGNLYVVPTPQGPSGAPTAIEDFFDSSLLLTTLNDKTFDRGNDIDSEKCYGKAAFAREVVEKNAGVVDFSGFKSILDRVVDVIQDYAKHHMSTAENSSEQVSV